MKVVVQIVHVVEVYLQNNKNRRQIIKKNYNKLDKTIIKLQKREYNRQNNNLKRKFMLIIIVRFNKI